MHLLPVLRAWVDPWNEINLELTLTTEDSARTLQHKSKILHVTFKTQCSQINIF